MPGVLPVLGIEGMDVVDSLYSGYGETSGAGMRQGRQGPSKLEETRTWIANSPYLIGFCASR
jgi:hypothetical protein